MNAGRDVERLISSWLAEEAADRSRDRVLAEVSQAVHQMPQRRFGAAWRNPMFPSPIRLAMMAAALAVAVIGGAILGRATAPSGVGPPANTPTPTAAATSEPLDAYRKARNAICVRYAALVDPLRPALNGLFDAGASPSTRVEAVNALAAIATQLEAMAGELQQLQAPLQIAADHARSVAQQEDMNGLIRQELAAHAAGDLPGAQALDVATEPIDTSIGAFEEQYGLGSCP